MTASLTAAPVLAPARVSAPAHSAPAHSAPDHTAAPALTWASPETKLWVATLSGEFAGYVEFTAGHFAVTDATGHPRPPHATLRAAQASLAPAPTYADAADAAATVFAVVPREITGSGRPVVSTAAVSRALAVAAVTLAGAALGSLALALNVLAV
jgi:hypothetical protein